MELFLIRHATAEDGEDDDARPLSRKGRRRFADVVRGLDSLKVRFERVLHSPKLRAVQTAELLSPVVRGELEVTTLLATEPSKELIGALTGDRLALVGHEPWLSALLAWLVLGDAGAGGGFELKKGAVACLEGEPSPRGMRLVALLPPRVWRKR